ncbi:MAG: hypothetical protein K6E24_00420, partial [bacterium]|nr:hypothetical protein [bacterium]
SKYNMLITVTEYKYNSEINEWQPYRDYDDSDLDYVKAEYFYENNKLVKKEYYLNNSSDYTDAIIELFDSEGKIIKREERTNEHYYDNVYETTYSIDTKLNEKWAYDDFMCVEMCYIVNDVTIKYYSMTLDEHNKPLYLVTGYYDLDNNIIEFVDVVLFNEAGEVSSVTRYENDFENNDHDVYSFRTENLSSYDITYCTKYDTGDSVFTVESQENSGLITFENAPKPQN